MPKVNTFDRNRPASSWHNLSWKDISAEVQCLRFRIFRCSRLGELKKLRRLQRLLINSDSLLLLAVRKFTQSHTPGVDGQIAITPAGRYHLDKELKLLGVLNWEPRPVKRIYIPRPDGRLRPLGIPTRKDRVVQFVIKSALEPEWEAKFEASSYGFRPGRQVNDAVGRLLRVMNQKKKLWVFEADVAKCFDCIDDTYLLDKIKYFPGSKIVEKWLKGGIFFEQVYFRTDEGTPQGSVISPLLCNIALDGIPGELGIKEWKDGRLFEVYTRGRTMIRYADDFVILTRTKRDAESLYNELEPILARRGLELSRDKTRISDVVSGFDFLGFNLRLAKRFSRKYLITHGFHESGEFSFLREDVMFSMATPSKKSFKKVKETLKNLFLQYSGKSPTQLVIKSNRVIRGWAISKRAWECFAHFKALDNYLYILQTRFIKRRHPNKNVEWRVSKYFALAKDSRKGYFYKWTFKDPVSGIPMLRSFWFWRRKHAGKVIDYVPVKLDQVKDNPDSREYFRQRDIMLFERGYANLTRKAEIYLASKQGWVCPVCRNSLGENLGEPIHRHHINPKSHGGTDLPSNLILVHWACHMKIHHDKTNLGKWQHHLFAVKRGYGRLAMPAPENPLDENPHSDSLTQG